MSLSPESRASPPCVSTAYSPPDGHAKGAARPFLRLRLVVLRLILRLAERLGLGLLALLRRHACPTLGLRSVLLLRHARVVLQLETHGPPPQCIRCLHKS